MPNSVTVTGPTGPARSLAAQVLSDVQQITLDFTREVASIVLPQGRVVEIDITSTTTVTDTITSGNHAVVISQ